MKKTLTLFFVSSAIAGLLIFNQVGLQANAASKNSGITAGLKPHIAQYKAGNYVGAIQGIDELLKKEPDNLYAKYYQALAYTRLGQREKAEPLYREVAESQKDTAISYYSQRALNCLADPNGEACTGVPSTTSSANGDGTAAALEEDDITKFIQSGQKIHPSAMDQITKERMERKLQQDEYQRKQRELQSQNLNLQSSNAMPTNEEIAAALNTLSKLGMNPYAQTSPLTQAVQFGQYGINPMMGNAFFSNNNLSNNNDFAKMFLYSQMAQNQNGLLNLGI